MVQVIIQDRRAKGQTFPNWSSLERDTEGQMLLQSEYGCCGLYITQTKTIVTSQILKKAHVWQCRGKSQTEKQCYPYKNYSKYTIGLKMCIVNYPIFIFGTGHRKNQA